MVIPYIPKLIQHISKFVKEQTKYQATKFIQNNFEKKIFSYYNIDNSASNYEQRTIKIVF